MVDPRNLNACKFSSCYGFFFNLKCDGALKTHTIRYILQLFQPVTSKEDTEKAALEPHICLALEL